MFSVLIEKILKIISICTLLGVSTFSQATAIVSFSGDITTGSIPASLDTGASESSQIIAYQERQGVVLSSGILVNFASSGSYAPATVNADATIPISAGTIVNSFLFHLDPPGGNLVAANAVVTFDGEILGVIASLTGLTATDSLLGAVGTTYETNFFARGMEPLGGAAGDSLIVSADLRSLTLNFAATALDEIRVLVGPSPDIRIPEPTSLMLFPLGFAAMALLRRREQ